MWSVTMDEPGQGEYSERELIPHTGLYGLKYRTKYYSSSNPTYDYTTGCQSPSQIIPVIFRI